MARGEFRFDEESLGLVKVFNLSGKIVGGPETQIMVERIRELLAEEKLFFVMNFRNVKWINSNGIGSIISCLTSLRNKGGDLRFSNVHHAASKYFRITKLDTIIRIFNNVNEAVDSFYQK
jgi:anti-sigma B factor antagonist